MPIRAKIHVKALLPISADACEECAECVMEPDALGAMMKDMIITLDPSISAVEVEA